MRAPLIFCKAQRSSDLLQHGEVYYEPGESQNSRGEGYYYFDGEKSHGPYEKEQAESDARYLRPPKPKRLRTRKDCAHMLFQLELQRGETREQYKIRQAKIKVLRWIMRQPE